MKQPASKQAGGGLRQTVVGSKPEGLRPSLVTFPHPAKSSPGHLTHPIPRPTQSSCWTLLYLSHPSFPPSFPSPSFHHHQHLINFMYVYPVFCSLLSLLAFSIVSTALSSSSPRRYRVEQQWQIDGEIVGSFSHSKQP